ncbi:MAG TPA: hypothetical protein VFN35_23105 [Ktedonobacteraceae bacterium]|nr:hypothetical protein [Ktedonobacteraceae bacterium]
MLSVVYANLVTIATTSRLSPTVKLGISLACVATGVTCGKISKCARLGLQKETLT